MEDSRLSLCLPPLSRPLSASCRLPSALALSCDYRLSSPAPRTLSQVFFQEPLLSLLHSDTWVLPQQHGELRGTRTPRGESEKSQDPLLSIQPHIVTQATYNGSMIQVSSVKVSLQKQEPETHPTGIFWVPTVCYTLFQEQTCTKQENPSSPGTSGL